MVPFSVAPKIALYQEFVYFAKEFELGKEDLLITNEFIYEAGMDKLNLECSIIFQEKFGKGEPSNQMMDGILAEARSKSFKRVVAVGGGSVLDVAKLLVLAGNASTLEYFDRQVPLKKEKELILIPTTCGTGSEMTNITIMEIVEQKTKKGLADPELYADVAVLIPGLLSSLPYSVFATSSIDALVHATESFVSPNANVFTELFSVKAIEMIVRAYQEIAVKGKQARISYMEDFLIASAYAGISFGNAGVGAVHAMSYPLGGIYHVPHGEANQQMFTTVFKMYQKVQPTGKIQQLEAQLAGLLNVPTAQVWEAFDELLEVVLPKKPLREYGMMEEDIVGFTESVIVNQQRLLKNNYAPLTKEQMIEIYRSLY